MVTSMKGRAAGWGRYGVEDFRSTDYTSLICTSGWRHSMATRPERGEEKSLPAVLRVPRTDRIYNCHAYLTKVPVAAIRPFIDAFTEPDERIADFFAGSGMTGIAAAMAGRRAVLSDISALGRHIARGYLAEVPPDRFRAAARRVVQEARSAIGDLYTTRRVTDGNTVEMSRTVWSFTYRCPRCTAPMVYYRHLRDKGRKKPEKCESCGGPFVRRSWPNALKDVPVQVAVWGQDGRLAEQEVQDVDLESIQKAGEDPRLSEVPSLPIEPEREMYRRSALAKYGLTETSRFFSPRNAIALLELWRAISAEDDDAVRQKLRFAFTAILPRASRRYQWGPKRPLNAQNQTYYIAPVYYEWNIFELFERKVKAAIRSDDEIFRAAPIFARGLSRRVDYRLQSADRVEHLADESVDYVFIDPPFGSNIFYSDMNLFQEAWLGEVTDPAREAVVHTTGGRRQEATEQYERLLRRTFCEAYRVLVPGRYLSVVFGNSKGTMWSLVLRAMRAAGFEAVPVHVAILDKGQRSVKGLNSGSERVVTVDLVLTVRKPGSTSHRRPESGPDDACAQSLLEPALASLDSADARNPSYIYAAVVREAIRRHQRLDRLHLGDVLIALRNAGYRLDARTGLLEPPPSFAGASGERVAIPR